jgi:prepilin-type N-terminal cleavage/methylation domain-containing protein
MRNSKRGLSLVEMLVTIALLGGFLYAAFSLYVSGQSAVKKSTDRNVARNSVSQLQQYLEKSVSGHDVQFLAFTGAADPAQGLGRFLIPQVDLCADLSTVGCAGSSSLLYLKYEKTTFAAASAICFAAPDALVVDTKNPLYGVASFAANEITVDVSRPENLGRSVIGGRISLLPQNVVALLSPPTATIWIVDGSPVVWPNDAAGFAALPPNCVQALRPGGSPATGGFDLSGLVRIPIRPYVMNGLTSTGKIVPGGTSSYGLESQFPMRLIQGQIESFGLLPSQAGATSRKAGVLRCSVDDQSLLSCAAQSALFVEEVSQVQLFMSFHLALGTSNAGEWLLSNAASPNCLAPTCELLGLAANPGIPFLLAGESPVSPLSGSFSLAKLGFLSGFRFLIQSSVNPTQAGRESVRVSFKK